MSSPNVLSGDRFTKSLIFCVVFCLAFFFFFFFLPLYCLSFFDLWILITSLVFLSSSSNLPVTYVFVCISIYTTSLGRSNDYRAHPTSR